MSLKREVFKEAAEELELKTLNQIMKAPTKRGWSQAYGTPIASVNDIKRDYNTKLRSINDMCVGAGHAPLYEDPDDEVIAMDSFK